MKNTIVAALAASITGVTAWGDASLAQDTNGNNYRNAVKGMTIDNVAGSGTYPRVDFMDPATGQCSQTPQGYSGPLGPLADEVSLLESQRACSASNTCRSPLTFVDLPT